MSVPTPRERKVMTREGLVATLEDHDDIDNDVRLVFEYVIGTGALSMGVSLAYHHENPDNKVAVRIFDKSVNFMPTYFLTEVAILQSLCHHNIMTISQAVNSTDPELPLCGIVMPYYEEGPLYHHLPTITLQQKQRFFVQLSHAVLYLHQRGIVHRDIKPSNVMMNGDEVILGDFSLAYVKTSGLPIVKVGTEEYRPPEVRLRELNLECIEKHDAYSLGVTLVNMLFGNTLSMLEQTVEALIDFTSQPESFLRLVHNLTRYKVTKRWSVVQMFERAKADEELSAFFTAVEPFDIGGGN